MTKLNTLRLALPEPSSMNCLTRALSPMGQETNTFGSWQSSTCTGPIHKSPLFVWNLGKPMESWCSLPLKFIEVSI